MQKTSGGTPKENNIAVVKSIICAIGTFERILHEIEHLSRSFTYIIYYNL